MKPNKINILLVAGTILTFLVGLSLPSAIYAVSGISEPDVMPEIVEQVTFRPCLRPSPGESQTSERFPELFTVSCINRSM